MQCPHCGRQLADTARFCPVCGNSIPARQQRQPVQQPPYAQQQRQQYGAYPQNRNMPARDVRPQVPQGTQSFEQPLVGGGAQGASRVLGIVSLVVGILGTILGAVIYPMFAIGAGQMKTPLLVVAALLGIVGIVTSVLARRRGYKNAVSMAGLVFSSVAIAAAIIFFLFYMALLMVITVATNS